MLGRLDEFGGGGRWERAGRLIGLFFCESGMLDRWRSARLGGGRGARRLISTYVHDGLGVA